MNRYGQSITWSTISAPQLFTGICTSYSYREARQRQLEDDESGDNRAIIQHSHKAELNFDAKITDESTNFLDLSTGAALTVSGISGGIILARRAVEHWTLGQPKTANIQATHYPDMTQTGTPTAAGRSLDAFTPSDQSGIDLITPGGKLIYGTFGLTHAAGVVHELEIAQELQITEDDPSPDGKLHGAASHGYLRTIRLKLLATAGQPIPATGSTLALTGAPDHAADYRIESADVAFEHKRGKMFDLTAVWIPPFTEG